MYNKWLAACAIAVSTLAAAPAGAQSTLGYAPTILIPVVAQTVSFASEIFVHNPLGTALTVNVTLVEATTSSSPGPHACSQLVVPRNR
jgi:hypothetical protein